MGVRWSAWGTMSIRDSGMLAVMSRCSVRRGQGVVRAAQHQHRTTQMRQHCAIVRTVDKALVDEHLRPGQRGHGPHPLHHVRIAEVLGREIGAQPVLTEAVELTRVARSGDEPPGLPFSAA